MKPGTFLTAILLLISGAVLASGGQVLAQGFMVMPMRMEATVPGGRTFEMPLQIRNTAGDGARAIDLRLVELSQTPDGIWEWREPGQITDRHSSSLAWTSLSTSRTTIAPMEPEDVMVRFTPPPSARGAYFAGIIAETPLPENATGVVVRTRFLIPVIIEIQGRAVRQQVELDDVEMIYDTTEGRTPTTRAHLAIVNNGYTFSRVQGSITVERQAGDRWRPVTRVDVRERSIIPGMTLNLGDDLGRRLPSGTYRLRGELQVDGRRVAPMQKEIEFVGDPNADALAYDTALGLEPAMVRMDVVPGATRTTTLRIDNPGTDPIQVTMKALTPRPLLGVEMDGLLGTELSAEPWTEIRPSEFTLRPGGRQNVRVMSSFPREGVAHPNYYADLVLTGRYADGQSAGETRSTVHLLQRGVESRYQGAIEQLTIAEADDAGGYFVQTRIANIGNAHVEPTARALVLRPQGGMVRSVALTAEEGALLPFGKRTFSGEISFAGLEPGYYALRSVIAMGGEDVTQQQIVMVEQVTDEDGEDALAVSIVEPETVPEDIIEAAREGAGSD
jgi:hypothetical protein